MADDDIAALLEDAALVMNSDDDDDDDGSFMSPGFVMREIDERKSPTDLVNSHHSSSSSKLTPTTFLDRMLNEAQDGKGLASLGAPNLDGPSAIMEEGEDDEGEFESDEVTDEDDDVMEDAKMEEDLMDIEALMLNQSLTDASQTSHASKDAFDLLMSQSVSDILKEQTATTSTAVSPPPPATSPPTTPTQNSSMNDLQEQKSPVDRALSGLFKAMGGVFLNQSFQRGNHAPIDEEVESDIEAEQDTPAGKSTEDKVDEVDEEVISGDDDDGLDSANSFSGQRGLIRRESSEDAMSFVTATEQIAEPTPRSLYMPPLETVESMDQATPKRSGSFAAGNEPMKPALSALGTEVVVNEEAEQQVSPMATLSMNQVEQVFRTNEVLVHPQQDLVSLSSASSTVSQVSKTEANSRWIKHPNTIAQTFNPSRSIFASKSAYDSNISEPGSPPEPVYSWADEEGDDAPVLTFPEAINWEMLGFPAEDIMTEASSVGASDHGSRSTRFSGKQRLTSPDRVANSMSRVKSPDRQGALAVSPSKARNPSLEQKLASVLSLKPIDLPFRYTKPKYLDFAASLLWQQLLACWKHSEMAGALTTQHPSRHFVRQASAAHPGGEGDLSSGSSRLHKPLIENLRLNGTRFYQEIRPETKNLDGFFPGDGLAMTRFIQTLPSRVSKIHHDVDDLLQCAENTTSEFAELMEDVAAFARLDSAGVSFEINVKDAEAITRKARQKYNGDVRQVKDVLRSNITFPTESSMVCGLVKLFELEGEDFKVVRIKNLFQRDENDSLVESPLPTRYRHILLNIKWKSGFLSEIQLSLSRMFAVMESEGYKLHRSLMDIEAALSGFPPVVAQLLYTVSHRTLGENSKPLLANVTLLPCTSRNNKCSENPEGDVNSPIKQIQAPNLDESTSNAEAEDDQELSQPENYSHLNLEALRKSDLCEGDIFLSIIEKASFETSQHPRDLPTHYCCYLILRFILHNSEDIGNLLNLGFDVKSREDLVVHTSNCLQRALKISNQAISVGMYGWLEYGTRSPLGRLIGQPFDLLRLLSYDYARLGQWKKTEQTLRARLLRCEQHLPRYHPTTIICMIDLAVASEKNGHDEFSSRLLSQAATRLSDYLKEMENQFLSCLSKSTKLGGKPGDTVLRIEHGRDSLTMLQSFVSLMRLEMKREMVTIAPPGHEAILANRCFLGESLCIFANCKSASRSLTGCRKNRRGKCDPLWKEAAEKFNMALRGLLRGKDISSMITARASFGVARCLRELDETDKALEILSIVAAKQSRFDKSGRKGRDAEQARRFLRARKNEPSLLFKTLLSALSLWLMAALALDRSPDEVGRGLAFRYLHAASVNLQAALGGTDEEDPLRSSYIQFLSMIEDEALQIAEPIYE